jgi:hypothetical protein
MTGQGAGNGREGADATCERCARGGLDGALIEAFERYKRNLPLSRRHVAAILMVSESWVKRRLEPVGRSAKKGVVWYAREDIDEVWRREERRGRSATIGPRQKVTGSRSSTEGREAGRSSSRLRVVSASANPSVEEVEMRLRGVQERGSRKSSESKPRLALRRSPESQPK